MSEPAQNSDPLQPANASDEELLIRYRDRGDIDSFEALVARYEKPLYTYLLRYVHNAALAEDLFQGTFLRVHERSNQFTNDRRVRPWLYSIATHLAIDTLRKQGRQKTTSLSQTVAEEDAEIGSLFDVVRSHTPSPLAQMEAEERAEWARAAVAELPEDLRAILLLAYFQGLKFQEVAEILQLPIGTVKSRLHRALVMLNAAWHQQHASDSENMPRS